MKTPTLDELRKLSEAAARLSATSYYIGYQDGAAQRPVAVHISVASDTTRAAFIAFEEAQRKAIAAAYLAGRRDMRERAATVCDAQAERDKALLTSGAVPRAEAILSMLTAREIKAAIRALPDAPSDGGAT